jgi:hypothetical protein
MSKTNNQEELQDEFMEDFKQPIGQIKQKINPQSQSIKLPPQPDMDEVLTDLKNHGDGWGKTLPKKGGRRSRSHKKRKKTKKRTHKKRKAKRATKRRAKRSA